jgi:hypothetical protein
MNDITKSVINKVKEEKIFKQLRKIYDDTYRVSTHSSHPTRRDESIRIMENAFKMLKMDVLRD